MGSGIRRVGRQIVRVGKFVTLGDVTARHNLRRGVQGLGKCHAHEFNKAIYVPGFFQIIQEDGQIGERRCGGDHIV